MEVYKESRLFSLRHQILTSSRCNVREDVVLSATVYMYDMHGIWHASKRIHLVQIDIDELT